MNNSNAEITRWVKLYTKDLLAWARRKVADIQIAEDLVQDTFVAAVEQFASFRSESQPKTWLIAILNNKISEYYRSKIKLPLLPSDSDTTLEFFFAPDGKWNESVMPLEWNEEEHLLDNKQFLKILQSCLEKLPETWHSCIEMKFIAEHNAETICQELNISTTNYWQIIHRAKLQLRHCLEHHWFRDQD